jgi:hypothetical protein
MQKNFWMPLLILGFVATSASASATETIVEKVTSAARATGRQANRGAHRLQEALCTDGEVKCALKKGANRVKEAGEAISDGFTDVKNKID